MDRDLVIRTINRCEQIGVFDMKCLKTEFISEKDKLIAMVDLLISKNTDDFDPIAKRLILMDDYQFNGCIAQMIAKAWVKKFDFEHTTKENYFIGF